ncbi:cytochrome P450 [Aspergillus pseudoustus]|uniref:Cytochrome P450 n=1 Tax=Aspergillus pseudoustus TaxID=1810923 RepID=A0ABR4JF20_9EURO
MLELYHIALIGAVTAIGFALSRRNARDPREPPIVGPPIPIPVLGHIIGLLRFGIGYFNQLTEKHPHPIFGIDLLVIKVYLVKSPAVLQAIQRVRALTFDPFVTFTTDKLAGIHGPALEALREKESGGGGGNQALLHAMHPTLTGKALDRMNERMVKLLDPLVEELAKRRDEVDLYGWCQHAVTEASTEANYGPLNPYKEKSVEDGFWAFESTISLLIPGVLPWLIGRKAYKGREAAYTGFLKYYAAEGYKDASELTIARHKALAEAGLRVEDIARNEVSMGLGLLSNSVPAAFWIIFDLFRRPELLAEIREEITANAIRIDEETGKHIINIPSIRDNCPLLVSTYQEILRVRSSSSPTRIATSDVLLADKYFIKKGSVISIPSRSIAGGPDVWGANSDDFNPRRFIKTPENTNPRRTGGFMTFGVSPVICPGRHFASSEIIGVVALLALRLEIEPVRGEWWEPKHNSLAIASGMKPVQGQFPVRIREREEVRGVQWDVEATGGSGIFPLMVA